MRDLIKINTLFSRLILKKIFKKNILVKSYKDSQGFRKYKSEEGYLNGNDNGKKLNVKKIDAPVFHYNGIRTPRNMFKKIKNFFNS